MVRGMCGSGAGCKGKVVSWLGGEKGRRWRVDGAEESNELNENGME